jgi:ABC-2 type transport system ATP-binding protein
MNNAIRCVDLSKKFRRVQALDRLNLTVPEGAIYALIGANGAGKTTAINTMMNIRAGFAAKISNPSATSRKTRKCRTG